MKWKFIGDWVFYNLSCHWRILKEGFIYIYKTFFFFSYNRAEENLKNSFVMNSLVVNLDQFNTINLKLVFIHSFFR